MKIVCPLPAALAAITATTCPFRFDQIVRFAFTRRGATAFATEAAMKTLAPWTPRLAASDKEKIVMSPFFSGMVIPQSEALLNGGGDNSTFNGIPEYGGEGVVTVTGTFRNMDPATKLSMDYLVAESLASAAGVSNLTIIMFNKDGGCFHATLKGFSIYNWRVSSVGSEGLNAPNIHNFSFTFAPDWDKDLKYLALDFDPLTAL